MSLNDKEKTTAKDNFKVESINLNNKTYKLQENNSCIVVDDSVYCTTEKPFHAFGLCAGIILVVALIIVLFRLLKD